MKLRTRPVRPMRPVRPIRPVRPPGPGDVSLLTGAVTSAREADADAEVGHFPALCRIAASLFPSLFPFWVL